MNRLDTIESRLGALETGGSLEARVAALEEALGLTPSSRPAVLAANQEQCGRCGNLQTLDENFRCSQTKCPIRDR